MLPAILSGKHSDFFSLESGKPDLSFAEIFGIRKLESLGYCVALLIIIIIDTFVKRHKCLGYRGAILHFAISVEHRLVTDGWTDGHTDS